jgi:hypothetical protein
MFRFLITSALTVSILITALPRKAEANEVVAGVVGGMVGLMAGSALEANAQRQRQCYANQQANHQLTQTLLMREVLQNYDPSYHAQFEEYVLIDLEGWLTNRQQQQLLDIMAQRHIAHCCTH